MSDEFGSDVRRAFQAEYQPSAIAAERLPWGSNPKPRTHWRRGGKLGVTALAALIAAAAISLPLVVQPTRPVGAGFAAVQPPLGYAPVATVLGTGGGRVELGVVPAGHWYAVTVQTRCTGAPVRTKTVPLKGGKAASGVLVAVIGPRGQAVTFSTAAPQADRRCSAQLSPGQIEMRSGGPLSRNGSLPLYIVAASGIAWRATLAIWPSAAPPPQLPPLLGTCSSQDIGWQSTNGRGNGIAISFTLSANLVSSTGPCDLVVPVTLGLYVAGTTTPLDVVGNPSSSSITSALNGAAVSQPLTWAWTNWCGPKLAVQAGYLGPGGALLASTSINVKLPSCTDSLRPSELKVTPLS